MEISDANTTKKYCEKKIKIELPTYYPNMTLKLIQSFEVTFLNTSIGIPMQIVGAETKLETVTNVPMTTKRSVTKRNVMRTTTVANLTDSTTTKKVQVKESQSDRRAKLYQKIVNKIKLHHQNATLINHVMQGAKDSKSPFSISSLQHVAQKGGNITHDISVAGANKVHEAYLLLAQVIHSRLQDTSKRSMKVSIGSIPMSTKTKESTFTTSTPSTLVNHTDDDGDYVDDQLTEISNYEMKSSISGWNPGPDYEQLHETGKNPQIKIESFLPSAVRVKVMEIREPGRLKSTKSRSKRQQPLEMDSILQNMRILNIHRNADGTFVIFTAPNEQKIEKYRATAKHTKTKLPIIIGDSKESQLSIKPSKDYSKKSIDSHIRNNFICLINRTSRFFNHTDIDKLKLLINKRNFIPKNNEPVIKNVYSNERTLKVDFDVSYLNKLKLCRDHIDEIKTRMLSDDGKDRTKHDDIHRHIETCKDLLNELKVLFNSDGIEQIDIETSMFKEKTDCDLESIKLFIKNNIGLLRKYSDKNAIEFDKLIVAVDSIEKLAETQDAIKNLASVCAYDEREGSQNSFLILKVKVCNFALKFLNNDSKKVTGKSLNTNLKLMQHYLRLIKNSNIDNEESNGDEQNYPVSRVRNSKGLNLMPGKLRKIVTKLNTNINEKVDITSLPTSTVPSGHALQYSIFNSYKIPNISDVILNKSKVKSENYAIITIAKEMTSKISPSNTLNDDIPNISDVISKKSTAKSVNCPVIPIAKYVASTTITLNDDIPNISDVNLQKSKMETTNSVIIPVDKETTSTKPSIINFNEDRSRGRPNYYNIRKLIGELEYELEHLNKPKVVVRSNNNFNNNVYGKNNKKEYHVIASVRQIRASEPKNVGSFTSDNIYQGYFTNPSLLGLSRSYYNRKYRGEENAIKYKEGGDIIYNKMLEYLIKGSDGGLSFNTGKEKNLDIKEVASDEMINGYTELSDTFNDDVMFEKNDIEDEKLSKKKKFYLDRPELKRLRRKKLNFPKKKTNHTTRLSFKNAAATVSTPPKIQSECDPLADKHCVCDTTKTINSLLQSCHGHNPYTDMLYQLMEFPCSHYKFMQQSLSIDDTTDVRMRDTSMKVVNVRRAKGRMGILKHNIDDNDKRVSEGLESSWKDKRRRKRKRHIAVNVANFKQSLKDLPNFGIAKNDVYVIAGFPLRLRCATGKCNTSAAVKWFKNGRLVEVSKNVELFGDTLGLRQVGKLSGGNYTCRHMNEDVGAAADEGILKWYHVSVVTLPHYELLMGMMYGVARPLIKQDLELLSVGGKLLGEQLCARGRLCNFTLLDVEGDVQKKRHSASGRMRCTATVSVRDVGALCANASCNAHCRAASHASVAYTLATMLPRIARASFHVRRTDKVVRYQPLETAGPFHWLTTYSMPGTDNNRHERRLRGHLDPFDLRLLISCDKGMRLDIPHKICVAHEGKVYLHGNQPAGWKKSCKMRKYTLAACVLGAAVLAGMGALFVLSMLHVTPFAKFQRNR